MRILHTADWHLGKNLEGQSRMDEQEEFLNDFVKIVEDNNIDLIMIAGDVYDNPNPPARAEKMFYDTLKRLSKNGERLTLVISEIMIIQRDWLRQVHLLVIMESLWLGHQKL